VKSLKKVVKYVKDTPNTFWIAKGDMIEGIVPSDPRFDKNSVALEYRELLDDIVNAQIEDTVKMFKPIANKCLGWHGGNHESKVKKNHHIDVLRQINRGLGVRIYPGLALTRLRFYANNSRWSNSVDVMSAHGRVASRKSGAKVNRLVDMMADYEADIYTLAHGHTRETTTKTKLYFDQTGEIRAREPLGAMTGSFLQAYVKGVSGYAEEAMYPPNSIGAIEFKINPRTGKIKHNLL